MFLTAVDKAMNSRYAPVVLTDFCTNSLLLKAIQSKEHIDKFADSED